MGRLISTSSLCGDWSSTGLLILNNLQFSSQREINLMIYVNERKTQFKSIEHFRGQYLENAEL